MSLSIMHTAKRERVLFWHNAIRPGNHKMIQCDISDGEAVKAMLESIVKEYGHLDVVVNNARNYKG